MKMTVRYSGRMRSGGCVRHYRIGTESTGDHEVRTFTEGFSLSTDGACVFRWERSRMNAYVMPTRTAIPVRDRITVIGT